MSRDAPILTEPQLGQLARKFLARDIWMTRNPNHAKLAFHHPIQEGVLDQWNPDSVGALWAPMADKTTTHISNIPMFRSVNVIHKVSVNLLIQEILHLEEVLTQKIYGT